MNAAPQLGVMGRDQRFKSGAKSVGICDFGVGGGLKNSSK